MAALALEIERVAGGHAHPVRPVALAAAEHARARMFTVLAPIRLVTATLVAALWLALAPGILAGAAIAAAAAGLLAAISIALHARARARTQALLREHHAANAGRAASAPLVGIC
jgi:hypothetical protein